jgi:hypothetical protein
LKFSTYPVSPRHSSERWNPAHLSKYSGVAGRQGFVRYAECMFLLDSSVRWNDAEGGKGIRQKFQTETRPIHPKI